MYTTINDVSQKNNTSNRLEAVLTVSAPKDHGKSTTLLDVIEKLLCYEQSEEYKSNVRKEITFFKTKNSKPIDINIIVKYCEYYIYIATGGDTEDIIKENIKFFKNNSKEFYMADVEGILQKHTSVSQGILPHICISASRTSSSDGFDLLENFARYSWIGNLVDLPKEKDKPTVDYIIRLIDKLL